MRNLKCKNGDQKKKKKAKQGIGSCPTLKGKIENVYNL
jgi:hypothetical protein